MKKLFITFEGLDGSGKSTALKGLSQHLKDKHPSLKYIVTREPGGKNNVEAEKIRDVILDKKYIISSKSEALLFAASRRLHLEKTIWPALKNKTIVLCDRYIDSSLAYQGRGRELGIDLVKDLNFISTDNFWPDLTFFFDINPEDSLLRIKQNAKMEEDRLELSGIDFYKRTYAGYQEIIKEHPDRFFVIDAKKSIEQVLAQVIKVIEQEVI